MYHVVFVLLAVTILAMGWVMVHSVPRIVSRILPRTLTFIVGSILALFGAFGGFLDAYYFSDVEAIIGCFVAMIVGVWFMLAPSSHNRGSYGDDELLKRVFAMLALVFISIMAAFYLPQYRVLAVLDLIVLTGGFWLTTTFLKEVDRGR